MTDYSHLKVGDRVVLSRQTWRTHSEAEVTRVGRIWMDVAPLIGSEKKMGSLQTVRRTDGRSADGFASIQTLAEAEEAGCRTAAEAKLREVSLVRHFGGDSRPLPTDLLVELAAVVTRHQAKEVLDPGAAGGSSWAWSVTGHEAASASWGTTPRGLEDSGVVEADLAGEVLPWLAEHGQFWDLLDTSRPFVVTIKPLEA